MSEFPLYRTDWQAEGSEELRLWNVMGKEELAKLGEMDLYLPLLCPQVASEGKGHR